LLALNGTLVTHSSVVAQLLNSMVVIDADEALLVTAGGVMS
jgi:hypothetical protein